MTPNNTKHQYTVKAIASIKKNHLRKVSVFTVFGLTFFFFPIKGKAGANTSEAKPLKRHIVEHCQRLPNSKVPIKTTMLINT